MFYHISKRLKYHPAYSMWVGGREESISAEPYDQFSQNLVWISHHWMLPHYTFNLDSQKHMVGMTLWGRDNTSVTFFISVAVWLNAGHGLLILEVSKSPIMKHDSRYNSSGWVISSSQSPLPDNSQQMNIPAPSGIRTHNLSRWAATDLHLRPRGHWDQRHL